MERIIMTLVICALVGCNAALWMTREPAKPVAALPPPAKPQVTLQVISLPLGTVCTTPTTQWFRDATGHWATLEKPIK
jgi:hypothetical protein